jgi:hypothetical protein
LSVRERLIDLLAERSPRSPHELCAAVDCPPVEVFAALNESSYDVERCAPEGDGHCWWFRLTVHGVARRVAAAKADATAAASERSR